jgi:hypothetical protein
VGQTEQYSYKGFPGVVVVVTAKGGWASISYGAAARRQ